MTITPLIDLPLLARRLYLVSGPAGTGKSTLLKDVKEFVISTDGLRDTLLGWWEDADGLIHRYPHQDRVVFEILYQMVEARAAERLTTFVDATLLTERDRLALAELAYSHGQQVEVLILDLDLEETLRRNALRQAPIPEVAVRQHHAKLARASALPHRVLDMRNWYRLSVVPDEIPASTAVDAIGDVHGLYDELVQLLHKLGYTVSPGAAPVHPDGRKLVFLGDMVDRGPKSLQVLELVQSAVRAGHYALLGNHEMKLLRFWQRRKQGQQAPLSFAAAETAMAFAQLPDAQQDAIGQFLHSLPVTLTWKQYGLAHADLAHYDPIRTPASELLYGSARPGAPMDTDAAYDRGIQAEVNRYMLVRGHIEATSPQGSRYVVALEERQAYRGHLVALALDKLWKAPLQEGSDPHAAAKTRVASTFDFDEKRKPTLDRLQTLTKLDAAKLATAATDATGTLRLWKYTKQVFCDALWSKDPMLLKARGLVVDVAGNLIVHPFDKVFNLGEEGAGQQLAASTEALFVEKLNGFLGVVSPHPHKKDLLVTTTGSFDSAFVGYVKDFLPGPVAGRILKRFHHKGPLSLMFEVLHPKDLHIIPYEAGDHGLWLIGARPLEWDAPAFREEELDELAAELGFRRPQVTRMLFGEAKALLRESRTEGFMVRDLATQAFVCKMKSPFYLTTKFLGRLTAKKATLMFKNPREFKKQVDEEFYGLVDMLVTRFSLEAVLAMQDTERVAAVQGLIHEMQNADRS